MRWLVMLVLVLGCGKPDKQCGPEAYELEEYLKKVDKGLGWLPTDNIKLVERTDLDKRFLQQSPVMRIKQGHFEDQLGRPISVEEFPGHIQRQRWQRRGFKDDQLALLVADDAPWEQVVTAVTAAWSSGITRVAFVFAANPAVDPPPRHAIDAELDRVENSEDPSMKAVKLAEMAKRVFEPCVPLSHAFGKLAFADAMDRETQIVKAMTPALLECDCKIDMGALRSLMYRIIATRPVVILDVALSTENKLELPPETPWREAQKQLTKSTRSLYPNVPQPEPPPEEPADAGVDAR